MLDLPEGQTIHYVFFGQPPFARDPNAKPQVLETFGPVRTVRPELVFELGFEGIQPSSRHKSGVAVRFPRILRWRTDKPAAEADTLDAVKELLPPEAGG